MANLEMAKNIHLQMWKLFTIWYENIFAIWTSPANAYPLATVIWRKKFISNGKNNSQLEMDNFVISRFAIIEEIASVYIMEVMKSKELLVEAGTKG